MKKMIFGLAVCVTAWTLLQIQSFNSALYLFVVLGLNPFNDKPVPTSTVFLSLAGFGLCMAILIFNHEINIFINALLSWVKNPEDTVLSVELEPLKEPRKFSFRYKPKLPDISMSKAPKMPRASGIRARLKPGIRLNKADLYKRLPNRQSIKNVTNGAFSFIRRVVITTISLFFVLFRSIWRAAYVSCRFIKATIIMLLMGLGSIELYVLKTSKRISVATYLKAKLAALTAYAITRDLVIYTLVLAGYGLLISILLGFIVWRLSEPYIRVLDRRISEKVHKSEQASHILGLFTEMFATFSSFRQEVKSLRRSLYR